MVQGLNGDLGVETLPTEPLIAKSSLAHTHLGIGAYERLAIPNCPTAKEDIGLTQLLPSVAQRVHTMHTIHILGNICRNVSEQSPVRFRSSCKGKDELARPPRTL